MLKKAPVGPESSTGVTVATTV